MNDESMNALGDVLYRKWTVYSPLAWLDHGVRIEQLSEVCGAPYGGPIAIVREDKQQLKAGGGGSDKVNSDSGDAAAASKAASKKQAPTLMIFTSSGILLAEVEWEKTKKIAGMGWTDQENLIIVLGDNSSLHTYFTMRPKLLYIFIYNLPSFLHIQQRTAICIS